VTHNESLSEGQPDGGFILARFKRFQPTACQKRRENFSPGADLILDQRVSIQMARGGNRFSRAFGASSTNRSERLPHWVLRHSGALRPHGGMTRTSLPGPIRDSMSACEE
jgi:hypothetical protein